MTTPFDAPDWRKLSRTELDRGLNNSEAVAGSGEIVAGWERQSAELRKRHADHLDLRYGPRERNRIDFLKVHDDAPTLLFIHGGYWQNRAKENFTMFAEGPLGYGINVALIGYTLAPDATLDADRRRDPCRHRFPRARIARARRRRQGHRGLGLVGRRAPDVDGAVASLCEGGHGDLRHL